MSSILIALSLWLHAIGTVALIGYYLLLALIYIPVLKNRPDGAGGAMLSEISKRSRLWLYISMLIFLITGSTLTLADPNYLGLADFGNFWSNLMLIKHLLILGMVAIGFWFNAILRVGPAMSSNSGAELGFKRFGWYVNAMAMIGVLVLLLTAVAQVK